jgi:hypothetical protein
VNNPLRVKKNSEHALCWTPDLPRVFCSWLLWAHPLQQLLLCFWIVLITINPTSITCYDSTDKNSVLVSLHLCLKTHVYVPLLLIICQESGEQTLWQCGTCSYFLLRSLVKLYNWSQWCLWAHGLFGSGLRGWILRFFQHFLLFCWCLVALNVHYLQLALALKHECHSKITVWRKECSPKASRSILRVSVVDLLSYMWNLMQTCCSILPSIADKTKHEVEKTLM